MLIKLAPVLFVLASFACGSDSIATAKQSKSALPKDYARIDNKSYKVIHVFVALCDNKYQGIVPVPASIGNGQNAATNLYWGAAYGVKSFFKKSNDWDLIKVYANPAKNIVERVLFKHKTAKIFLVADAYDGQFIRQTTIDFLKAASGDNVSLIVNNEDSLYAGGAANLLAYIGHDGLMDFELHEKFTSIDSSKREAIILACYSKHFFSSHLQTTGAKPLLWTSGLMAPEAYALHAAIGEWIDMKPEAEIRMAAAKAYSKYQKCSVTAATNLLTGGW